MARHLLHTPERKAWQPGRIPWLRAAGNHVSKARPHHAAQPSHTGHPARAGQEAPVVAPLHRAEPASIAKPAQRIGSEARYVRRWLQPRLPDLCEAVLRSALGGDMEATRLLLRMGGLDGKTEADKKKKPTKTGPGFAKKAMDEFRSR